MDWTPSSDAGSSTKNGEGLAITGWARNDAPMDGAADIGFRPADVRAGREFVRALRTMPEAMVVVRDSSGVLIECNNAYAMLTGKPVPELVGRQAGVHHTTPALGPFIFKHLHAVFEQGVEASHWMLVNGRRCLARAWPLSRDEFGTDGYVMAIVPMSRGSGGIQAGVCLETTLGPLSTLSPTEMAVLYHCACGLSRAQTAAVMSRSEHTIHEHFKGIHTKLTISRREDLSAFLADLGIRWFTPEQWRLLTGAPV